MALVIVLSMIVLVTVAAMAFFARATSNRVIEASRANQALGGQLARTAEDYVLSQLIGDLDENATPDTQNGVKLYLPANGLGTMPPRRLVDSSLASNTNFANLAQQSGASGGGHATTDPARNGRAIPPERWNAPRLLFGGSFASNNVPRWIYVLGNGTITDSVSSTNAPNVVGRFAYNIYNTSGLLDANLAGNPSLTGTNLAAIKGTQAGADLTALPGFTATSLTNFITFRNPQATAPAAYVAYTTNAASENYRSPVSTNLSITNNLFHSRQDLIRYATRQNPSLTNALPFLTHTSTAANRPTVKVDGDGDGTPDEEPVRRVSSPDPITLTRYHDDGTSYEDEVKARDPLLDQRFSLAKLAWLTPTGPNPEFITEPPSPDGVTRDELEEAIQSCFGLVWNPTDSIWTYAGPTGTDSESEISALDDVASENRDANFFELLNAGIGKESLDLAVDTVRTYETVVSGRKAYSGVDGFDDDRTPQYQVVSIAANIIDQADPDNYPTRIKFDGSEFYGLEDLPQIAGLYAKCFYKYSGDNLHFGDPPVSLYLIPQLWNPHRSSSHSTSLSPPAIKLTFVDGSVEWNIKAPMFNPATGERGGGFPEPPTIPPAILPAKEGFFVANMSGEDVLIQSTVSGQDFTSSGQDFRAAPDVIRPGAGIDGSLKNGISPFTSSGDYFPTVGIELGKYEGPGWPSGFTVTGETAAPYTAQWSIPSGKPKRAYGPRVSIKSFTNVMVTLSYLHPDGNYRTYSSFFGKPNLSVTGLNAMGDSSGPAINAADLYAKSRKDVGPIAIRKLDPRTSRFGGFATGQNAAVDNSTASNHAQSTQSAPFPAADLDKYSGYNYVLTPNQSFGGPEGYMQECPWIFDLKLPSLGRYPAYLSWQNQNAGRKPNSIYADTDGVIRPADGYLARTAAHPMYQTGTGAAGNSTSADRVRPIILQRPFRSVAELGYVFRDQPWKSLDFFSDKSADGALLDLFCVSESTEGGAVGKLNANSAPAAVLDSLLRSEPYDEMDARYPSPAGSISTNVSKTLSEAVRNELASNAAADRSGFPALVASNKLAPTVTTTATTYAKPSREAGLRALNDLTEFSTWRVQADIIVQGGKFSPGQSGSGDFLTEAEERVWSTLALDRVSGDVLFSQSEHPSE